MIVVTGAPRSGTSLMMRLIGNAIGYDKIIGVKHTPCDQAWMNNAKKNFPGMTAEQMDRMASMSESFNPDGYWETDWTMTGIPDDAPDYPFDHVIKLVGTGLEATDATRIERVILMVRDPRTQTQSAARITSDVLGVDADYKKVGPGSWCEHMAAACRWLDKNRKQTLFVMSDRIAESAKRLSRFIGVTIDTSCVRKVDANICPWPDGGLWPCAKWCYERISNPSGSIEDIYGDIHGNISRAVEEVERDKLAVGVPSDFVKAMMIGV